MPNDCVMGCKGQETTESGNKDSASGTTRFETTECLSLPNQEALTSPPILGKIRKQRCGLACKAQYCPMFQPFQDRLSERI